MKTFIMESSQVGNKTNKIKSARNSRASRNEAVYKRLELKLEIPQKQIRDLHKKFLKSHPRGEMTRDDFVDFLQTEKNIKPYVARALFRSSGHVFSISLIASSECLTRTAVTALISRSSCLPPTSITILQRTSLVSSPSNERNTPNLFQSGCSRCSTRMAAVPLTSTRSLRLSSDCSI